MRNSFSFAVGLHRVFDSAPPNREALFYSDERRIFPIQKPNGLYAFLQETERPLTVMCDGFISASVDFEIGKVTPAALYPDRCFAAPTGWRLVCGEGEANRLLYSVDNRYELKLMEYDADRTCARIRSRRGFIGGCFLFETGRRKEIALILEKKSPDIFYLSKLTGDYTGADVQRVYCARTDANGKYYLAIPEDFSFEAINYL